MEQWLLAMHERSKNMTINRAKKRAEAKRIDIVRRRQFENSYSGHFQREAAVAKAAGMTPPEVHAHMMDWSARLFPRGVLS